MQGPVTTAQADSRACDAHSGFSTQHSAVAQLWCVCTTQPAAAGPQTLSLISVTAAERASTQVCRLSKVLGTNLLWHTADKGMQGISDLSEMGAEQTCRVPLVDGCMDVEGSGFWLTFPRHHIALQQERPRIPERMAADARWRVCA